MALAGPSTIIATVISFGVGYLAVVVIEISLFRVILPIVYNLSICPAIVVGYAWFGCKYV